MAFRGARFPILATYQVDQALNDTTGSAAFRSVVNGMASANPVFKVLGAVTRVSLGASDAIDQVPDISTISWKAFNGANNYGLEIYSLDGVKRDENFAIVQGPDSNGNITPGLMSTKLVKGVVYQWRVTAGTIDNRNASQGDTSQGHATQDKSRQDHDQDSALTESFRGCAPKAGPTSPRPTNRGAI